MGVLIIDINSGETISDTGNDGADNNGRYRDGPEMGEWSETDSRSPSRERLPFGPAVTPGLQEVPVTPVNEREKNGWRPEYGTTIPKTRTTWTPKIPVC